MARSTLCFLVRFALRLPRHVAATLTVAALLLVAVPAAAQTTGFAQSSGQVVAVDLEPGVGELPWSVAATHDLGGSSGALARGPDGDFWGTNSWWPNPDRLVRIDGSNGDYTFVGSLDGPALWADLTFDDQGRLWMTSSGELFEVDPSDASTTAVPVGTTDLLAVAFHEGTLYGIRSDEDFDSFQLITLDPEGGDHQDLVVLQGFTTGSPCFLDHPTSMDFDAEGGLWVVVAEFNGTCIVPFITSSYLHYADPLSGVPGDKQRWAGDGSGLALGLAVGPGFPTAVEVPALDPESASVLALLLFGLAMLKLRRPPR